jgi:hypothetical protein
VKRAAAAVLTVATVLAAVTTFVSMSGAAVATQAAKPYGTFNGCPVGLLPLPSARTSYVAPARRVALRFLKTTFASMNRRHHWHLKLADANVRSVVPVPHWLPSGWIRSECGARVWQRSLAVGIWFPAMDYANPKGSCADCDHVTLLLGRTDRGWVVWGQS